MTVRAKEPHTSVVCIKFREEVFFQLFVERLFVSYEFNIFIGEFMPGFSQGTWLKVGVQ
jgi:hypothetical protein